MVGGGMSVVVTGRHASKKLRLHKLTLVVTLIGVSFHRQNFLPRPKKKYVSRMGLFFKRQRKSASADHQIFFVKKFIFWHGPSLHSGTGRLGYDLVRKVQTISFLLQNPKDMPSTTASSISDDAWGRVLPTARLSFCIKQRIE